MRRGQTIHDKPALILIRARLGSLTELARRAGVSRAHLSEALAGKAGRGGVVRVKVAKHMTAEELAAAGWTKEGKLEISNLKLQIEGGRRAMSGVEVMARVGRGKIQMLKVKVKAQEGAEGAEKKLE